MRSNSRLLEDKTKTTVFVCLGVITLHLVNASLFHLERSLDERLAWAALALFGAFVVAVGYPALNNPARGLLVLPFGLSGLVAGVAIHAVHVAQMGVQDSSWTGIPMLIAAVVLTGIGGVLLVRSVHDWWRRLAFIPVAAILLMFVLFPLGLGVAATNIAVIPTSDTETPADRGLAYEDASFPGQMGVTLRSWFIASSNGATIITVHGAGTNRSTVLDEAEMLVRHGYGVLMIDVEGFGDSDGRGNALGWIGASSVHAATAYLASRGDVDAGRIGGLGLSMGGEVLLQAAGESTALQAIVAEGATGRTAADFRGLKTNGEFMYVFHSVVGVTMELISGEEPPPPLKEMVQQIAPRRVLLIGADVPEEEDLMAQYAELGGPTFDLWFIPEAKHVGAFDLHHEEYEQRVVAFFDSALSVGDAPGVAP